MVTSKDPVIEVIAPKFDLHGRYDYHIKMALTMNEKHQTKVNKLKNLVQQAYEQGVEEGSKNKTFFD